MEEDFVTYCKKGILISENNIPEICDDLQGETALMIELILGNGLPSFANILFDATSPSAMLLAKIFVGKIDKENLIICIPSYELEKSVSEFLKKYAKFITLVKLDETHDRKSFRSKFMVEKIGCFIDLSEDRSTWLHHFKQATFVFQKYCKDN